MDEKKVRDAIYCIKTLTDDTVCKKCDNYERCDHKMIAENARIAIEALGKQLPKKPKQSGITVDGVFHPTNGIDGVPYDLCPNCEMNLCTEGIFARDKRWVKYCNNCGQRLYW